MMRYCYLENLAAAVAMPDEEHAHRLRVAGALQHRLRQSLSFCRELQLFGSMTRRTALAPRLHPDSDVDLLVAIPHKTSMALEGTSRNNRVLKLIRDALVDDDALSDIRIEPPCVSLMFSGIPFQLFPASYSKQPDGTYLFSQQLNRLEDPELGRYHGPGVASADPDDPEPMQIEWTNPFLLNNVCRDYDDLFGEKWRQLVLLLKYWRLRAAATMTSHVLESNALTSLGDVARYSHAETLLDTAVTLVRGVNHYHYDLFRAELAFVELKGALEEAHSALRHGDVEAAHERILDVLPPPPGYSIAVVDERDHGDGPEHRVAVAVARTREHAARVEANPLDTSAQIELAKSYETSAALLMATERTAEALDMFRSGVELARSVHSLDADHGDSDDDEDREWARDEVEHEEDVEHDGHEEDEESARFWRVSLSNFLQGAGQAMLLLQDFEGAIASLAEAEQILKPVIEGDGRVDAHRHMLRIRSMRRTALIERGDLHDAIGVLSADRELIQRLVTENPRNTGCARDLCAIQQEAGMLAVRLGDSPGALYAFEAGRAHAADWVARDPDNPEWPVYLSTSHAHTAGVFSACGNAGSAFAELDEACRILVALAERRPADDELQKLVAHRHVDLAQASMRVDDQHRARDCIVSARNLMKRVLDQHPDDVDAREALAITQWNLGETHRKLGEHCTALAAFEAGTQVFAPLLQSDATPVEAGTSCAVAWGRIASLRYAMDDVRGALIATHEERTIYEQLSERDPDDGECRVRWMRTCLATYELLDELDDLHGALALAVRAREIGEELAANDDEANAACRELLFDSHLCISETRRELGDHDGALAAAEACWQLATERLAVDPNEPVWLNAICRTYCICGMLQIDDGDISNALKAFAAGRELASGRDCDDEGYGATHHRLFLGFSAAGEVLREGSRFAEAAQAFGEARAILEDLKICDPTDEEWDEELRCIDGYLMDLRASHVD